jgi:hypothetical protein
MAKVLLDLNHAAFQKDWFALERQEAFAVLATLTKLSQMNWDDLYRDRGLRWEAIQSRVGPADQRLYSLRVTKQVRAVAFRDGTYLRFLSLHPDHDSAYD